MRPTLLQPFWIVAGFALGAATALIGPEAAMACTAAVETEIDKHYSEQLDELGDGDPELSARSPSSAPTRSSIARPRSPRAPSARPPIRCCPPRSGFGCRTAIALSKRV